MIGINNLSLTVLGSGTCVPSQSRSSCSILIHVNRNRMVFDIGYGTLRRLVECGVSPGDVTHIFISHFHPDHTADLAPLLFAAKYPVHMRRQHPLTLIAGTGFRQFYEALKSLYGRWVELDSDMFVIHEMSVQKPDCIRFDDFSVHSIPMNHNPESVAFKVITNQGSSVVYSGDTDYTENLILISNQADILICESAFPDAQKVDGHLTPSLAGAIATDARVKNLVLTHFYPECDAVDIEMECRKTYNGPLILAKDLMRL
ncbi:MAG: MBL fold metallo-hydrolase [Desulfatirhabdiaceae bacterium]